jgi:hypothetical protein
MVLFPEPDGPTIAVDDPTLMVKDAFYRTFLTLGRAVGYLNVTFWNLIALWRLNSDFGFSLSLISGTLSITSKTFFPTINALVRA